MSKGTITAFVEKSVERVVSTRVVIEFMSAFFIGHASLFSEILPFGPAFAIVCLSREEMHPVKRALLVSVSLLGGVMSGIFGGENLVTYIITAITYLFLTIVSKKINTVTLSLICGVSVILSGVIFLAADKFSVYRVLLVIIGSAISMVSTYIISVAFSENDEGKKTALFAVALFFIMGIASSTLGGIRLGLSLGGAIVMLVSEARGKYISVCAGLLIGLTCAVYHNPLPEIAGMFSIYGLFCGMSRRYGRGGISLAFFITNWVAEFFWGGFGSGILKISEIAVSIAIFMLVPKGFVKEADMIISEKFFASKEPYRLKERLKKLCVSLKNVSGTFFEMSEKVDETCDFDDVFNKTANGVCRRCNMRFSCWEKEFDSTYNSLLKVIPNLKGGERIRATDFDGAFLKRCVKTSEFAEELTRAYKDIQLEQKWKQRVSESQLLSAYQLESVSQIIEFLASETDSFDCELVEKKINSALYKVGVRNTLNRVFLNNSGRYEVTVETDENPATEVLESVVSAVLEKKMQIVAKNSDTYYLSECEKFSVECAISTYSKEEECGDTAKTVRIAGGKHLCLISDGMGSGSEASKLSKVVVQLMHSLSEAGFSGENAVGIVNSALMTKTEGEKFATVDMCITDLFSGRTEFLKGGCPPSYVVKRGEVLEIGANSYPAGIFKKTDISSKEHILENEDIVIMLTDGVMGDNTDWVLPYIKNMEKTTAEQIADNLLKEGKIRNTRNDDMTVVVMKMQNVKCKVQND